MPLQGVRLSIAVFALCCGAAIPSFAQPVPDGMPSAAQFGQTIKAYPYHASIDRVAKIKAGLAAMKPCMDKSTVQALLGAPDYSDLSFGPKGPSEKWLGSYWMYYLSKRSHLANENDPSVFVSFDTKGLSRWVAPRNIEGAKDIGGVGDTCA